MAQYVLGSMPDDTVPPTSLPPDSSLILAGFHILVPGGAVKALPYFQVLMLNGPWLTAPAGATSLALLSTPAGAANGNWLCCACATAPDRHKSAHAADIPTNCALIISSAIFASDRSIRNHHSGAAGHRLHSTGRDNPTIMAGASGRPNTSKNKLRQGCSLGPHLSQGATRICPAPRTRVF